MSFLFSCTYLVLLASGKYLNCRDIITLFLWQNLNLGRIRLGRGGGLDATLNFSLNLSKASYQLHLPFSVDVCLSHRHSLAQAWKKLAAMVTRFEVISNGLSGRLWRKCGFLSSFRLQHHKPLTKSSKTFNYVIFYMSGIKIFNSHRFVIINNIW